jgi:hypothetical protein
MQHTNIFTRRLAPTVVLALIVLAAFGVGAAGAAGVSQSKAAQAEEFIPGVTDFPSRLWEPAETAAEEFIPGVTDFPSRLGEVGERAAEARLARLSQQGSPVYVRAEASGFDWSAGATGAIAATLLLLGAALAVRTARRSRVALG